MATSNSKNYSITRATIIETALRRIGEYDQGEAISGDETSAASIALNLMSKEWVARGIDIWLRDDVTVFLQKDQQSYDLGTAHAATSFVETTLSAAEASGQTVLSVTDSTGMTAADFVGIKIDDNSIQWTTISTVDTATQITVAAALTSGAGSGNKVYTYTTKAGRPQKILYAYRRDINDLDTEVFRVGQSEYNRQSNKGSSGPPVEIWYQPTLTTGTLNVWPVDGGSTWDKLILVAQFLPDDFDAASDNPEYPIEWGNALIWGLAAEISSEYGLPEREQARLWKISEFKLEQLLDYDTENAPVRFALEVDSFQ